MIISGSSSRLFTQRWERHCRLGREAQVNLLCHSFPWIGIIIKAKDFCLISFHEVFHRFSVSLLDVMYLHRMSLEWLYLLKNSFPKRCSLDLQAIKQIDSFVTLSNQTLAFPLSLTSPLTSLISTVRVELTCDHPHVALPNLLFLRPIEITLGDLPDLRIRHKVFDKAGHPVPRETKVPILRCEKDFFSSHSKAERRTSSLGVLISAS
ncbi:hypothetical protein Tco_1428380 [Tanacetum coccineum]